MKMPLLTGMNIRKKTGYMRSPQHILQALYVHGKCPILNINPATAGAKALSIATLSLVSDPGIKQRSSIHRVTISVGHAIQAGSLLMTHLRKCCLSRPISASP